VQPVADDLRPISMTRSAVKPKAAKICPTGAEAPKRSMPKTTPSSPA
jgi:hypothetical protein